MSVSQNNQARFREKTAEKEGVADRHQMPGLQITFCVLCLKMKQQYTIPKFSS